MGPCSGGTIDPFFEPQFDVNGASIPWETKRYVNDSNSYLPVTDVSVVGNASDELGAAGMR